MLTQTIFIQSSRHWNYSVLPFVNCILHICSQNNGYIHFHTKYDCWNVKFIFFKKDNFVKNHSTTTKFKLELLFPKMYLYVKFEVNVYNHWEDNERKLKISDFFSRSRGITLTAIIKPWPNLKLTNALL
jgi:hypothetical protein